MWCLLTARKCIKKVDEGLFFFSCVASIPDQRILRWRIRRVHGFLHCDGFARQLY